MEFPGKAIVRFYRDGFRSMELGRTLWKLVAIKLFILFALIRFFLMPDILHTRFSTNRERANHVLQTITRVPNAPDFSGPGLRRQP
jgi:hypothetical protein